MLPNSSAILPIRRSTVGITDSVIKQTEANPRGDSKRTQPLLSSFAFLTANRFHRKVSFLACHKGTLVSSRHCTPGKEVWYPLYMRLGEPRGRSGLVRKISFQPGFDPSTVQPVAGLYTDNVIPAARQFIL
jgi:hypothetical protein